MIQSLLFCLREGWHGFRRSRLAGLAAVATVSISLILIGVFLIVTINLGRLAETLRKRVELEVFLDDSLDSLRIEQLGEEIRRLPGVEAVEFVSKEMAIAEFEQLFEGQHNDYFETLGYNPLPASFRVKLNRSHRNVAGAQQVAGAVAGLDAVLPQDVVYRREFLMLLEKYIKLAVAADLVIGLIVCVSALLLVSNNIRLIIWQKRRIIETMKLVGATRWLIETPLYIQGILQGLLGGMVSAAVLAGIVMIADFEIPGYISVDWRMYGLLVILGILLGFTGSFSAVRRHLK